MSDKPDTVGGSSPPVEHAMVAAEWLAEDEAKARASADLPTSFWQRMWIRIKDAVLADDAEAASQFDSLPEAYRSVAVPAGPVLAEERTWGGFIRGLLAYVGPGYMVAVGYMDPGNWATDLAGGAMFGYKLLFVVLMSSLLAIFLQLLTVKLGLVTRRDLAQLCRDSFSPRMSHFLWITAEIAIMACDLAEVIGSAIALELLLGIPLVVGCVLTTLDVLLVLGLFERRGRFRIMEVIVMAIIGLILVCFIMELVFSQPNAIGVLDGLFVPDATLITNPQKLYIAMGILGATVMPHNLYLHSSIVQTRDTADTVEDKAEAIRFSAVDTVVALTVAFLVNASILMVAAAAFHEPLPDEPPSLTEAYYLLSPVLGNKAASILFGVALLASGQNSTLTATLAGQIIMEGFVRIRLKPWVRQLVTRLIVVVPAIITVAVAGQSGVDMLLVLSQVILSMQLSFAVFPLVMFTSDPVKMGPRFVNSTLTRVVAWIMAFAIAALNGWLLVQAGMTALA